MGMEYPDFHLQSEGDIFFENSITSITLRSFHTINRRNWWEGVQCLFLESIGNEQIWPSPWRRSVVSSKCWSRRHEMLYSALFSWKVHVKSDIQYIRSCVVKSSLLQVNWHRIGRVDSVILYCLKALVRSFVSLPCVIPDTQPLNATMYSPEVPLQYHKWKGGLTLHAAEGAFLALRGLHTFHWYYIMSNGAFSSIKSSCSADISPKVGNLGFGGMLYTVHHLILSSSPLSSRWRGGCSYFLGVYAMDRLVCNQWYIVFDFLTMESQQSGASIGV